MRHALAFALIALAACQNSSLPRTDTTDVAADGKADTTTSAPRYLDAIDYLDSHNQDSGRFYALRDALKDGFDRICGDTFCGGDMSNLQALQLTCSVSPSLGKVNQCVWIFAGSFAQVTASTGTVRVSAKTFTCKLPVNGTVKQLMDTLLAPGTTSAIDRPLPGGTTTAYDALGGCLP
jgi:hypothetical protein